MNIMKYQNDKEVNHSNLKFCTENISKANHLRFLFCLSAGNGCVQQDFAALPRNDGLRLSSRSYGLISSPLDQFSCLSSAF